MDQISPPMRIALVAVLVFAGVWFAVLRPSSDSADTASAPVATATGAANDADPSNAQTGLGKAAEKARAVAQAQEKTDADTQAATGGATATATAGSGAATAPTEASDAVRRLTATGLPKPVSQALADRQVVVLLFWDRTGVDDRAVKAGVAGLGQKGKVFLHTVPLGDFADYGPIVRQLNIDASPAVVVVGPKRTAQVLTGYQTRDAVRQAIADARRRT